MNKKERWEKIKELCREHDGLTIEAAMNLLLDTSHALIRRDFRELAEETPQITWVPGLKGKGLGRITWNPTAELDPHVRRTLNTDPKRKIANIAVEFARAARTIFVDGGSTLEQFIEVAIETDDLMRSLEQVYTTSMDIASRLLEWQEVNRAQLGYLIGGPFWYRIHSPTQVTGWNALSEDDRFDVAFIGVPGVDENGFLSQYPAEADNKKAAIRRADTVVLLSDSSKFDSNRINELFSKQLRHYFGRFDGDPSCKGFRLISDENLSDDDKQRLEAAGITVNTP
jgi:DeoR/GlpR family transcriptional regulator of sugar metabolism